MLPTIAELEAELAALEDRRRIVAALVTAVHDYERASANGVSSAVSEPDAGERRGRKAAKTVTATEDLAIDLMEKIGGPVTTGQIVAEMQRRGMDLPMNNPNNVVSARLSNSDKFKAQRGRGYWFADKPWPDNDLDSLLG